MDELCRRLKWMSDDQYYCYRMLCLAMGGDHHLKVGSVKSWGNGICYVNKDVSYSTFDFHVLTVLVVLAHDWCIRLEVSGHKLIFHRRKREGNGMQRHPTMEEAVTTVRSIFGTPQL